MNKQQALEAIVRKCRSFEQPNEEVRRVDPDRVFDEMMGVARDLEFVLAGTEDEQARLPELLVALAGSALYLLVDEVTLVEFAGDPPTASEMGFPTRETPKPYPNPPRDGRGFLFPGAVPRSMANPAAYMPHVLNGVPGRRLKDLPIPAPALEPDILRWEGEGGSA